MQIKEIIFLNKIEDLNNDNIDIGVIFDDNHSYVIIVRTPKNLLQEMEEEKTNFIEPGTPSMIVKKLTKEIITEAIEAYLKLDDGGYWVRAPNKTGVPNKKKIDICQIPWLMGEYRVPSDIIITPITDESNSFMLSIVPRDGKNTHLTSFKINSEKVQKIADDNFWILQERPI